MRTTSTISALCALLSVASASPVTLDKRATVITFWNTHHFQNTCVPGFCTTINQHQVDITGCDEAKLFVDPFGSYCDKEFTTCGRTFKIVRGENGNDCRNTRDLGEADNGSGYGVLKEGDKDVGSCGVDTGKTSNTPVFAGSFDGKSMVTCTID